MQQNSGHPMGCSITLTPAQLIQATATLHLTLDVQHQPMSTSGSARQPVNSILHELSEHKNSREQDSLCT